MNILFLSLLNLGDYSNQNIYGDLLKTFRSHGHAVYAVSPCEPGATIGPGLREFYGIQDLKVATGKLTKCGMIEKGLSLLRLPRQMLAGVQKSFQDIRFDLVLYATPPVSLAGIVASMKKESGASTYLMLKDIFPQNAVDIGILSKTGIKGLIYRYYKHQETMLYRASDYIGCMSQANVDYVLSNYPEVDQTKVEICANSLIPVEMTKPCYEDRSAILNSYEIPSEELVFVYGGNLGRPQGIPFILDCITANERAPKGHILIVGSGTELPAVSDYFSRVRPRHAALIPGLPRDEYEQLVRACDAGLIFLDSRFTIPNFPSRLLSYLQAGLPVICATDEACDMGRLAEEKGFGLRCSSKDVSAFLAAMEDMGHLDRAAMGQRARSVLEEQFTAEKSYQAIVSHF